MKFLNIITREIGMESLHVGVETGALHVNPEGVLGGVGKPLPPHRGGSSRQGGLHLCKLHCLGENVAAKAVAGSEECLHLHDGGFAWSGVIVRGKGRGATSVMFNVMFTIDILHDTGNGMTVGSVVFAELIQCPLKSFLLLNAKAIHPVYDARDIRIALTLSIFDALALHQMPGGSSGFGARRATAFLLRLVGLEPLDLHSLRQRTEQDRLRLA